MEKLEGKLTEKENGLSMLDMLSQSPEYEIPENLAEESIFDEPEEDAHDLFSQGPFLEPQEQERRKPDRNDEVKAKMAVTILDMINKHIGAAISGESSSKYKMDEDDRKDFITVTKEYFSTLENSISPALMFWSTFVTILGATIYQAQEDKKARLSLEKHKAARQEAAAIQATVQRDRETIARAFEKVEETKPEGPKRERFETDADGFFERDIRGNYVEKKDRAKAPDQHPGPEIKKIIEEGKEMKMSKGEINRMCREFLYGESN